MAARRTPSRIDRRYWLLPLVLAASVVWCKQITVGGLGWSDAPLHAMDGVFIHDLVRHFPGGSPQAWAESYFAKYPCLGLIVYYPPVFAVVEAAMFAVFGISAAVARLTVVLFALAALLALYWVARQLLDRDSAVFAAAVWAAFPSTVLWSRQVMLEVPAVALVLVCCGLYLKFRSTRRMGWLWAAAAALVLAVLTKQWAAFIGLVMAIDLVVQLGWRKALTWRTLLLAAVTAGLIVGYVVFSWHYAHLSRFLVRGQGWSHLLDVRHWAYYLFALPEVLGWAGLMFSIIGLLLLAVAERVRQVGFALLWIVVFYVFASVVYHKEPRYFYFVTPPAAMLIGGGLSLAVKGTDLKRWCEALLLVLVCWQFVVSWYVGPGRLSSYRRAASLVHESEPRGALKLVLVDAVRDGQFVFDMRVEQGFEGRAYTLRGSKVLYSRAARMRWQYSPYVETHEDVRRLIDRYGIEYIVVENVPPRTPDWQDFFPPPSRLLREVLADPQRFRKIDEFAVADDPRSVWYGVNVEVYRNLQVAPRRSNRLKIPIPAMGRELELILPE